MTPSTAHLRELARKATPGPWRKGINVLPGKRMPRSLGDLVWLVKERLEVTGLIEMVVIVGDDGKEADLGPLVIAETGNGPKRHENAAFIAACTPESIAALCDRADEAERLRKALTELLDVLDRCDAFALLAAEIPRYTGESLDLGYINNAETAARAALSKGGE